LLLLVLELAADRRDRRSDSILSRYVFLLFLAPPWTHPREIAKIDGDVTRIPFSVCADGLTSFFGFPEGSGRTRRLQLSSFFPSPTQPKPGCVGIECRTSLASGSTCHVAPPRLSLSRFTHVQSPCRCSRFENRGRTFTGASLALHLSTFFI